MVEFFFSSVLLSKCVSFYQIYTLYINAEKVNEQNNNNNNSDYIKNITAAISSFEKPMRLPSSQFPLSLSLFLFFDYVLVKYIAALSSPFSWRNFRFLISLNNFNDIKEDFSFEYNIAWWICVRVCVSIQILSLNAIEIEHVHWCEFCRRKIIILYAVRIK